jgi:hypothetical protein
MRRSFVLVLGFVFVGGCWARRAPTSALEVVREVPAGAVRVGPKMPTWLSAHGGDCTSPPQEIVVKAQSWGAAWLVLDEHKNENVWTGAAVSTTCNALGYAPGDAQ